MPVKRFYLDLFSGIGGFALGAFWAGVRFNGHYFSEVDSYAVSIYQKRFPDAIPLGDIRKIDGTKLPKGKWGLSGGFPCQDISIAGKGAGLEGDRSGLWYEYARLIGEIRPEFAIMENVGAITFRGLDGVLLSLARIGYDAEWQDIRASDLEAPHRRERIWILAYPQGGGFTGCHALQNNNQIIKTGGGGMRIETISRNGEKGTVSLNAYVRIFPKRGMMIQCPLNTEIIFKDLNTSGQLNPIYTEWLMGYPLGWTDLNASVMPLSLKLPK
jgi:DNA (cytosine-5)-methyltransferase 1